MSTLRIDDDHNKMLDELQAQLTLRGQKFSKKELIARLIENAMHIEGIIINKDICPLEKDPAWIGLNKVYHLGISDLSTHVDDYLYKLDGDK